MFTTQNAFNWFDPNPKKGQEWSSASQTEAQLSHNRDTRFTDPSYPPYQRNRVAKTCYPAVACNAETPPVATEKMPLASLCNQRMFMSTQRVPQLSSGPTYA